MQWKKNRTEIVRYLECLHNLSAADQDNKGFIIDIKHRCSQYYFPLTLKVTAYNPTFLSFPLFFSFSGKCIQTWPACLLLEQERASLTEKKEGVGGRDG